MPMFSLIDVIIFWFHLKKEQNIEDKTSIEQYLQ